MNANAFRIDDEGQLSPFETGKVADALRGEGERIWLDLQELDRDELEPWLDTLSVDLLARRLCLGATDRPGFYPLKNEILLVIPVATGSGVEHVLLLCRENLLLTLHQQTVLHSEDVADIEASKEWLSEPSVAGLTAAILVDQSLRGIRHVEELRRRVRELEDRMDREPSTVKADEIMDLRSGLLDHGGVISDQLPAVEALSETNRPFFRLGDAREYMNCALANLRAAEAGLSRLGERVSALRSEFQLHAQDETNRRLNVLTILSAIFMPITLLAGIWGMNFASMPELTIPYAYPMGLGLMALIAWAGYRAFRRQGWFS